MPRVCMFDVNETLLDLKALDPHFARVFGDTSVRQAWFAQMIQSALVATVTNTYATFGAIGGAALDMTTARRGVALADADRAEILGTIRTLPPHPEVIESLDRLRAAGLRLVALTNSTAEVAEAQLSHAGAVASGVHRAAGAMAPNNASMCLHAMAVVHNGRLIIRQAARNGL